MKIWITGNVDFPEGRGGTPRVRNLAVGLAARGHDVCVYIPHAAGYAGPGQNDTIRGSHKGVSFRFLNNSTIRPPGETRIALAKLTGQAKLLLAFLFGRRPDSIIIYSWSFYETGLLIMLARALGKTVILDVTDERFDVHAVGWKKSLLRRINAWQARTFDQLLFRKASGFMAVSSYLSEKVKSYAGEHPVRMIPLIADIRKDLPRGGPDPTRPATLAYVGSFIPDEGLEMLIEAVSILRDEGFADLRCLLIGGANDPSYEETLTSQIAERRAQESVLLIHSMRHQELIDLLSTVSLLVLPRPDTVVSQAGFPGKLSEYFSSRRPIVTTLFGDIGRYIEHGKTGYVCPDYSAAAFARTVKRALEDASHHEAIADAAIRMAIESFDYPRAAEQVEQFLFSLMKRADA